jgi:hypothetical protein
MYSQNFKTCKLENQNIITISVAKQWIRVILFGPSGLQIEQYKYATHFLNLELYEQELLVLVGDESINSTLVAYTKKTIDQL